MTGLVTVGESLGLVLARREGGFDLVSDAEVSFGGAESNVAITAARLGAEVTWVGRLGDDAIGRRILRTLRAEGVATHAAIDELAPTALMLKDRPRRGRSRVTYYRAGNAGSRITPLDLPLEVIAAADVLHVTGITLALGPSARDTALAAVRAAAAAGVTVSFDINHRAKLWAAGDAAGYYREILALSDVVFAGDDEARILVDGDDPLALAAALQEAGPRQVVIKRGAEGADALDGDRREHIDAFPVDVVDTVGAGDAFVGGYLVELMRGEDLSTRLQTAAASGACACRGDGDWEFMPTPHDIHDLLNASADPVER